MSLYLVSCYCGLLGLGNALKIAVSAFLRWKDRKTYIGVTLAPLHNSSVAYKQNTSSALRIRSESYILFVFKMIEYMLCDIDCLTVHVTSVVSTLHQPSFGKTPMQSVSSFKASQLVIIKRDKFLQKLCRNCYFSIWSSRRRGNVYRECSYDVRSSELPPDWWSDKMPQNSTRIWSIDTRDRECQQSNSGLPRYL